MDSTRIGGLHCPFHKFHDFHDGKDESKGVSRMVSHLKILHLCIDNAKIEFRKLLRVIYICLWHSRSHYGELGNGYVEDVYAFMP